MLPPAVPAETASLTLSSGAQVAYYSDTHGEGLPLVLIHSINAAPSTYEVKPLFEHYQGQRPVFSPDLPGFGLSSREDREYSPAFYTEAILSFLRSVVQGPADVIALSLSSEFAAMAALENPDAFHSLTFVSPTGFNAGQTPTPADWVYDVLAFPLWGQGLYNLLVTRRSIRYFLGKNFAGDVPGEYTTYAHATSHQPGARFAPLRFLSGQLFTPDVRTQVYNRLTIPSLLLYDEDPNVRFDTVNDWLKANPKAQAVRVPNTLGLPHWDELSATIDALEAFWEGL